MIADDFLKRAIEDNDINYMDEPDTLSVLSDISDGLDLDFDEAPLDENIEIRSYDLRGNKAFDLDENIDDDSIVWSDSFNQGNTIDDSLDPLDPLDPYFPYPETNEANHNNNRPRTLIQIDDTKYLQLIDPDKNTGYPYNPEEMVFLIKQLDPLKKFASITPCIIQELKPEHLDTLYLSAKQLNIQIIKYIKYNLLNLHSVLTPILNKKITSNYQMKLFLADIYSDLIEFFIEIISLNNSNSNSYVLTKRLSFFLSEKLNSPFYKDFLIRFNVCFEEEFFESIYLDLHTVINNHTIQSIQTLEKVISSDLFTAVTDELIFPDIIDPLSLIGSPEEIHIIHIFQSDPIDHIKQTLQRNIPLYKLEWMPQMPIEIYKSIISEIDNNIQVQVAQNISPTQIYGLDINFQTETTNILDLFVKHNLIESSEKLLQEIINLMIIGKDQSKIDYKFNFHSLTKSFEIASKGVQYDDFIALMQRTNILPESTPIEFILRLISRILGVDIEYYYRNVQVYSYTHRMRISNSLFNIYCYPVIIYQTKPLHYSLLSVASDFEPISNEQTKMIIQSLHRAINVQNGENFKKSKKEVIIV